MDTGSGTEGSNTRDDVSDTTELEITTDELTIELDGVADGTGTDEVLGMTSGIAGRQPYSAILSRRTAELKSKDLREGKTHS